LKEVQLPRVLIAGLAGDVGKSLVTLGVIGALRARGRRVAPFKKGPDFIDAAWLGAAADSPGRNLDTFMMPRESILRSLADTAGSADIAVVEGNRGLFDGLDAHGSHSSAQLARMIAAPVVLVVDATKTTRTVAALVLGCRAMDPELEIAGVILNRVGTARQEAVIREAVAKEAGLPVLGAIPRLEGDFLPSRHLGLVTALEHPRTREVLEQLARAVEEHVDLDALQAAARGAGPVASEPVPPLRDAGTPGARIGVLRDRAFSFYYPENLAALEERGACLLPISPMQDSELPELDGLYAGGGFPEVHAEELTANEGLRARLRERIADGLPVWAECGGLMYLSRALVRDEVSLPMVGALPIVVEQKKRPQGHGYVRARVDRANPFLGQGTELRGHEFHYSRVRSGSEGVDTALEVQRGVGVGGGRDGIQVGNVVASYTHVHALGTPEWAPGIVAAVRGGER
jgi:cobyrinic acid a,c-diamide synthase